MPIQTEKKNETIHTLCKKILLKKVRSSDLFLLTMMILLSDLKMNYLTKTNKHI